MYWKENIWKAENSFSSSIKTHWIGELHSFSWFADEPTKTFTSLICFWSFSDDETLALLIRFWWLAEERPFWLVDLENSQTNKMLTFLVFLMICRRGNTKLGIDLVVPPCVTQQDGWLLFLQTLVPQRVVCYFSYYAKFVNTRNVWAKEGSRSFRGETVISLYFIVSKHDKTMLYQAGKNKHKVHIEIQIQIWIQAEVLTVTKQQQAVASRWGAEGCRGAVRLHCDQAPNCQLGDEELENGEFWRKITRDCKWSASKGPTGKIS